MGHQTVNQTNAGPVSKAGKRLSIIMGFSELICHLELKLNPYKIVFVIVVVTDFFFEVSRRCGGEVREKKSKENNAATKHGERPRVDVHFTQEFPQGYAGRKPYERERTHRHCENVCAVHNKRNLETLTTGA